MNDYCFAMENNMYLIKEEDFGLRLSFSGELTSDEMLNWLEDSKETLRMLKCPFGAFIDLQDVRVIYRKTQELFVTGEKLFKESGMNRSVVIVSTVLTQLQFSRIAAESGIYSSERIIDSKCNPNWEIDGLNWVINGIEPYKSISIKSRPWLSAICKRF